MAKIPLILARADSSCGKVFHPDRRAAEDHRIVLEVWNRATAHNRDGYKLSVFQCMRCGGFHVGQRRVDKLSSPIHDRSERDRLIELHQKALNYLPECESTDDYEGDDDSQLISPNPQPAKMIDHRAADFRFQPCL